MIGILRIELRRSPVRWLLLPLILLGLTLLFAADQEWIGNWPQTYAHAQRTVMFLSVALAATAAWSSGRVRRNGMTDRIASGARRPEVVELVQLIATLTYGLAAYVLITAGAVIATAAATGGVALWPSYLLLGLTTMVSGAAFGHLIGRLLHPKVAAPLAGAATLFVVLSTTSNPILSFVVLSGRPQVELSAVALAARALLAALLAAAAVVNTVPWGRAGGARRPLHRIGGAVLAGLLGIVPVAGVVAAGPISRPREAPENPFCAGTGIRVCIWPENEKYLGHAAQLAERIAAVTALTPRPVTSITFFEEGLRPRPDGNDDGFPLGITDFSTAYMMALQMLPSFTNCPSYDSPETRAWTEAWVRVMDWILVRGAGPIVADRLSPDRYAAARKLADLPEGQQRKQIEEYYTTLAGPYCGD